MFEKKSENRQKVVDCQHGGFTDLHEFAMYVKQQRKCGFEWKIHTIWLRNTAVIVYIRNNTKISFDAITGRLLSYSDNRI